MLRRFDYTTAAGSEAFAQYVRGRMPGNESETAAAVSEIVRNVREHGDRKLFEYTLRFDGVSLDKNSIIVTEEAITEACARVPRELLDAIGRAAENIRRFHEKQIMQGYMLEKRGGASVGLMVRPLDTVGIYVPGGSAPLPSTVLMNAIPAKLAGVRRIIMATPPKKNGIDPALIAAAREAGVDTIYMMGGAQAVAAMAYGTETVPRADKITGPGNKYVALAKKEVFGACGIDMIAGPSEICIVADAGADSSFIAADMLSQAEHDADSSAVLITDSTQLISSVEAELKLRLGQLSRKDTAAASLEQNGAAVLVADMKQGLLAADLLAPEHLELMFDGAEDMLDCVRNAGAVFIGRYSPEACGDYMAGTNHVLPTAGTARFSSGLGVYDFVKRISWMKYTKESLSSEKDSILALAGCEGLDAHAMSVKARFEGND